MPRMRTLHSEFFSDIICQQLDPWGRLFYQGTWCFADDLGRGRAMMRELAGFIFPHDEDVAVRPYFDKLNELGKIHTYEVAGQPYYHLPNWYKYQRPNRPTPSKLPCPTVVNCHGCHAMQISGRPFIDRFPLMWEARACGLDLSEKGVLEAVVADHTLQLSEGIAVPTVRTGTRPHSPLMDLIERGEESVSESVIHSLNDSTLSPRRNKEVGSRNQEVGIRNNNVAGDPATHAAVFQSLDEVPSHVPYSVARDMLPAAPVDSTGMPDEWLEGLGPLINRFLGYYARGGALLPAIKTGEIKQFLVNHTLTARQAIALFDAFDADTVRRKGTKPRVQSINWFSQPFQALVAAGAAVDPQVKEARKGRFSAYTAKRTATNDPSDRQHA